MKITKQLLREMIEEETSNILLEKQNHFVLMKARTHFRRIKKVTKSSNMIKNLDRGISILTVLEEMLISPTDYDVKAAESLGLLPPTE